MTHAIQQQKQDSGSMWDALSYRRWLIILFGVIGFCIGLAVITFKPATYKASSLVMIQPAPQIMPAAGLPSIGVPPLESFILSQVEILRSQELLQKLADNYQGQNASFLAHALEVEPVGRSLLLRVTFKHKDPRIAAMLANDLVTVYLHEQISSRNNDIVKNRDWLQKRMEDLGQELAKLDKDTTEYRHAHQLDIDLSDSSTLLRAKNVSTDLDKTRSEATSLELQGKQIATLKPQEQRAFVETSSNISPMLASLTADETRLMTERAQLLSQYGDRHPLVLQANARVRAAAEQKSALINDFIKNIAQQESILQAKSKMLATEQEQVQAEIERQKMVLVPLTQLQEQKEIKGRLYKKYLARYQDFLSAEYMALADAKVASKAVPPQKSSDLNPFALLLAATLSALFLGVLTALLLNDLYGDKND